MPMVTLCSVEEMIVEIIRVNNREVPTWQEVVDQDKGDCERI